MLFSELFQGYVLSDRSDRMRWSLDPLHFFSISSVIFYLDSHTLTTNAGWTRWNDHVPIKLSILVWRIELRSIHMRMKLLDGIDLDHVLCLT